MWTVTHLKEVLVARSRKWWLVSLLLLFLACTIDLGGPTPPAPPASLPSPVPLTLEEVWRQAVAAAVDGRVVVQLHESQWTAWLAEKLAARPDAWFQEPVVLLRDGQMQIYGRVYRGRWVANVRFVFTVSVDASGNPQLALSEADFGPWPLPQDLLQGLSAMLDEAFTGRFGPVATGLRLESITIENGIMTLVGRIR